MALNERQGRSRHIAADDHALGVNAIALLQKSHPSQRSSADRPLTSIDTRAIALGRLLNGQSQTRN